MAYSAKASSPRIKPSFELKQRPPVQPQTNWPLLQSATTRKLQLFRLFRECFKFRFLLLDLTPDSIQFFADSERVVHGLCLLENGQVLRFLGEQIAEEESAFIKSEVRRRMNERPAKPVGTRSFSSGASSRKIVLRRLRFLSSCTTIISIS